MLKSFLFTFFSITSAVLLGTLALSHYQGALDGDLTRIGFYSERNYGWRAAQPVLKIAPSTATSLDASIWVLGDSFSIGNAWQSELGRLTGLQTKNFHYNKVGCINNWFRHALDNPAVKTLVIESAQISILERFDKSQDCAPQPITEAQVKGSASYVQAPPAFSVSTDWRIKHSLQTAWSEWQVSRHPVDTTMDDQVGNSPLRGGCARFSNHTANRVLYQKGSIEHSSRESKDYLNTANHLMQWNDAAILQGKRLIFLAVPDKFSAYRDCIADASVTHNKPATDICKQITANWMGAQPLNCPNLQELVESNRNTVIDLYRPNDGHFGNAGYSLLGKAVADALSGK